MTIDVSLIPKCLPKRRQLLSKPLQNNIVKQYDFFLQHELKVTESVKNIRYYSIWFDILQKHTLLKVGHMDDRTFYQHEVTLSRELPTYFLCEYPTDRRTGFWECMMTLPTPKLAVFHIFDSFSLILDSLDRLNQNGLYLYGFGPDNVVFGQSLNPILRNFESCCFTDQLPFFLANTIDYQYKPFEFHLLRHLAKKGCVTVSSSLLDEIQPENDYFSSFLNKPIETLNTDIMSHAESWDKCNLALLYLHLIEELSDVFSLTYKFMIEFIDLLRDMSVPNPVNRLSNTANIRERLNSIRCTNIDNCVS